MFHVSPVSFVIHLATETHFFSNILATEINSQLVTLCQYRALISFHVLQGQCVTIGLDLYYDSKSVPTLLMYTTAKQAN